jgi:hypothetical protein
MEYISYELEEGGEVLVQPTAGSGLELTSRTDTAIAAASASFGAALSSVRKAAGEALTEFRRMAETPSEIKVEFGVVLHAEAGAMIAKTGVEGQLKVTLTWKPRKPAESGTDRPADTSDQTSPR